MKKSNKRTVGDALLDLEELWFEVLDDHELQLGDVHYNLQGWAHIHYPDAVELYEDGTEPVFFYGHLDELKKLVKKLEKREKNRKK